MSLRPVGPPAALAVSVADAKLNMRIDGTHLDALVEMWLKGVIGHAEGFTQRTFMARSWRLMLDRFPEGAIKLERPPLMSVSHIKYYDAANILQTLDPVDYLVDGASEPGYIVPAPGRAWPSTFEKINAVEVQFICGYGVDATATPDELKLYILAKLQEQFDPATRPEKDTVQSTYIDNLLWPFRIF